MTCSYFNVINIYITYTNIILYILLLLHTSIIIISTYMHPIYPGELCTPSRCGRMDQCVAMGSGSVGLMTFDNDYRSLQLLPCKTPLYFVVADLNATKNTTAILRGLRQAFPTPKSPVEEKAHDYLRNVRQLCYDVVGTIESGNFIIIISISSSSSIYYVYKCIMVLLCYYLC